VEMGDRFQRLAHALLACPEALEIVRQRAPDEALAHLRTEPAAARFVAGFDAFVAEFGHRAAKYPLSHPRWREEPSQVVRMLAVQAERGTTIDLEAETRARDTATGELHRILRARRWERIVPVRRALLHLVLRAARIYCGVLRENEGFYITKPFPDVKRLLGVIGCRLAERNRLARPEDVYFLTLREIRDVLRGRSHGDLRGLVAERRHEFHAAAPEAGAAAASGETLRGVPVSPGVATGRAVVLADPTEPFEPGSILVTKTLNPSWFATVMLARGVVADFGGQLSHGAVLAREFRIPAVLGVNVATRLVRAGQVVTVNGSAGTVILASE
jgi:rifampicin phosphotransferase